MPLGIDPNEFANLINSVGEFKTKLEQVGDNQQEVARITQEMLQVLFSELEKLSAKTKETTQEAAKLGGAYQQAAKTADDYAKISTKGVDTAAKSVKQNTKEVEELTTQLKKAANAAGDLVSSLSSGRLQGAMQAVTGSPMIGRFVGFLQESYDRTRNLNKQILEFAGASQQFGKAAVQVGRYRSQLNAVADSMGLSIDDAYKYAKSMQAVGFSLDDVTSKTNIAGRSMTTVKAVQAASISIGASFEETNKLLAESMLYLGETSREDAVKGLVNIGVAARDAGSSAKILMPVIKNLMGTFRFLGMEVPKTTNFIAQAGKGSKTAAADMEVMGKAVGQMVGMAPGAKAFFASMGGLPGAGGAGPIGGIIAFERALAGRGGAGPGEAFGAIAKGLGRATGGGIVGQERVLAGEVTGQEQNRFWAQRRLLQQQLGVGEQEAGRLLEIMSRIEKGTAGEKDRKELEKTMKNVGKDQKYWVQKTFTSSQAIANKIDRMRQGLGERLSWLFGDTNKIVALLGIGLAGGIMGRMFGGPGAGALSKLPFLGRAARGAGGAAGIGGTMAGGMTGIRAMLTGAGKAIPFAGGLIGAGMEAYTAHEEGASGGQTAIRAAGAGVGGALGAIVGALGGPLGVALGSYLGAKGGAVLGKIITSHMKGTKLLSQAEEERLAGLKKLAAQHKKMTAMEMTQLENLEAKKKAQAKMMSEGEKWEMERLRGLKTRTKEEDASLKKLEEKNKQFDKLMEKTKPTERAIEGAGYGGVLGSIKRMINPLKAEEDISRRMVAEKEKELKSFKGSREVYKAVQKEVEFFTDSLKRSQLQQEMYGAMLKQGGKKGMSFKEARDMLQGAGVNLNDIGGRDAREAIDSFRTGGDVSFLKGEQLTKVAAAFRDRQANRDVMSVFKKGLAYLSPGDWVVNTEDIANIMGGEKGAAFPKLIQQAIKALTGGAMPGGGGGNGLGAAVAAEATIAGGGGRLGAGVGGGTNEIAINIRGEGIFENIIDERVLVNVKNGTIVGTQKTRQQASA